MNKQIKREKIKMFKNRGKCTYWWIIIKELQVKIDITFIYFFQK